MQHYTSLPAMKTKATFALALCATLAAGGCAFAPGQHLDRSQLLDSGNAESSMVELVPITPKLLAIQAAAATPATVPQALLDYKPGPYRVGAGDVLHGAALVALARGASFEEALRVAIPIASRSCSHPGAHAWAHVTTEG